MTARDTRPEPVVCGQRENRPDGHAYECVGRPQHERENLPHVWFRLVRREAS